MRATDDEWKGNEAWAAAHGRILLLFFPTNPMLELIHHGNKSWFFHKYASFVRKINAAEVSFSDMEIQNVKLNGFENKSTCSVNEKKHILRVLKRFQCGNRSWTKWTKFCQPK